MKRDNLIVAVFGAVFLFSLIMLFSQGIKTTGYATQASTTSNVTITTYFSIAMSENLSDGIQFGNVSSLPATNVNATHNYDGVETVSPSPGTSMWMNVSSDSNTNVDFCINADALNTSGGDEIGLGNETFSNSTDTNSTLPALGDEASITLSYADAGYNITIGGNNYYRFWLDVPAGTPAGTYNNTVSFKGITTGGSC